MSDLDNFENQDNRNQKSKQKSHLQKQQEIEDFKALLSTESGRRIVWKILGDCGTFMQTAVHSGSWTYFNEGRRSIGTLLLNQIMEVRPEAYTEMTKENTKGS